MMKRSAIVLGLWLLAAAATAAVTATATPHTLYMGTAPVVGVYFPAGGAVCAMVNIHRKDTGLRCVVESTEGSVANLRALRQGEEDLAIVQSDWQYFAVNVLGPLKA